VSEAMECSEQEAVRGAPQAQRSEHPHPSGLIKTELTSQGRSAPDAARALWSALSSSPRYRCRSLWPPSVRESRADIATAAAARPPASVEGGVAQREGKTTARPKQKAQCSYSPCARICADVFPCSSLPKWPTSWRALLCRGIAWRAREATREPHAIRATLGSMHRW
jgi:hypothetical protein